MDKQKHLKIQKTWPKNTYIKNMKIQVNHNTYI